MTLRQYEAFLKTGRVRERVGGGAGAGGVPVGADAASGGTRARLRLSAAGAQPRRRASDAGGQGAAAAVEQVCAADAHLQHRIQEVRERTGGTIRIATFKSVAVNWLPPMIKEFQAQHPEARFRLFDGAYAEVDAYVRSGTVDMGFVSLPSELPGEIVPVCSDRLLAVLPAGHPLAAQDARADRGLRHGAGRKPCRQHEPATRCACSTPRTCTPTSASRRRTTTP